MIYLLMKPFNAVGSHTIRMRQIDDRVMAKAPIVVDQLEAALSEAGEIVSALRTKSISKENIRELGTLVSKKERSHQPQISVFKSVGLAIQDISIANAVYINAMRRGLGTNISL